MLNERKTFFISQSNNQTIKQSNNQTIKSFNTGLPKKLRH